MTILPIDMGRGASRAGSLPLDATTMVIAGSTVAVVFGLAGAGAPDWTGLANLVTALAGLVVAASGLVRAARGNPDAPPGPRPGRHPRKPPADPDPGQPHPRRLRNREPR